MSTNILPVTILITTYNRRSLLERCIKLTNERTFFPYRIIVIDNASTDGTQDLLRTMKVQGKIFDAIFMEENVGQCRALSAGFDAVEQWENNQERMHRPSNDFLVSTQDDIFPPMFSPDNCWLKQLIEILERNEPEYGGICMRIQRMPRTDIDEGKEIIPGYKNFPSVFRLMRRSDLRKIDKKNKFGDLRKWESNITGENYKNIIRKKFGFATHIYADHAGFMLEKKGFPEGIETFTVAENKLNERNDKPYPDIDPLTNEPIKINHNCDAAEQKLRDEYQAKLRREIKDSEVTVIVLTYNRYDGLNKIIESIKTNTNDIKYNLLVMVDGDDTEAYNYCQERGIQCLLSNVNRDFTAQANLGVHTCQTPYFFILADDMEVLQPNWLSESLRIFKEKFPDNIGIMTVDEGLQHGRIFTTGMSSKKFVHFAGGNLYYPKYIHFGGDNELSAWTKHLNLYHYAESIKVNHFHPSHKVEELKAEDDETYEISQPYMHQDQVLKKERKSDLDKLAKEKNYYDYL